MVNAIKNDSEKSATRLLVGLFVILACGIVFAGWLYFRHYEERFRLEAESRLSSIAELKVDQLVQWRKERLGDGAVIYGNRAFSALVRRLFSDHGDREAERELNEWINRVQAYYQYESIFLLDTRNLVRISAPSKSQPVSPYLANKAADALRSGKMIFVDFYRQDKGDPIHLSILVPIFDESKGRQALGVLLLMVDPGRYLYPFISRWPVPSRSSETLLIRREENEVVYLNELRFDREAHLSLRFPLTRTDLPAVKAVTGRAEVVEGIDYRGLPVIAALRPVPGSPWFLVAKMDKAEIYAPIRERLWLVILFVVALLTGSGAGVGLVWRAQSAAFYKEKFRIEQERLESEQKFRTLFENMLEGFAYCKMEFKNGKADDFTYLKVNQIFEKLTGLKDVEGKRATEVIPGIRESDQGLLDIYGRASRTGIPERIEIYVEALKMWFSISVYSPGKEYFVAVFDVITERKRAEEGLRASEVRYRRLFESAKDGILIIDSDTGMIVEVNPFLISLLGFPHEAFIGSKIWELGLFRDIAANQAHFAELQKKEYIRYEDLPLETADGRRIEVEFVSNSYLVNGHKVIQCNIRDVSERKKKEREIEEKNAELERFAYTVSHDLKSPLVTVKTFLGYLEKDMLELDEARISQDIGYMHTATDKMGRLLDELLEMSRVGRMVNPPVIVSFCELVEDALGAVAGSIAEGRVEVKVDDAAISLYGDRRRLAEIWQNLIENAVKYMGDQKSPRIAVGAETHGKETLFFVSDNGIGIDPHYAKKIFGLFEKLDSNSEGTGLGLALVKRIVTMYHGDIRVESDGIGKGSCFLFTLPGAVNVTGKGEGS